VGENFRVCSMSKKVALILSGCGGMDGSETQEAVCSLLAIEGSKMSFEAFSLNEYQQRVFSATKLRKIDQKRNMIDESARITHGNIQDIKNLDPSQFDVLWFPGGYGIVSSFSDFAEKKFDGEIHPVILEVIKEFYSQNKTIVALCIAPVLLAKAFEGKELKLTLGSEGRDIEDLKKLNHIPIKTISSEYAYDEKGDIYTSCAYMDPKATCLKIFSACTQIAERIASF
jgi:enhancing lycopene biosynthesis protein 2